MIHRQDQDGVAVLRLENGPVNAIDLELFADLERRLDEVESSSSTRALVVTGTGTAFSAGVDLFRVKDGGEDYVEAFLPLISTSLRRLFELPLPVVAAVNGHAIAGGLILALACDHRVMAEGDAKLGLTELAVGVPFPVTALEIVRFQAPGRTVQDLVLSARTMPVAEALALKLVDEVVPAGEVVARAVEVAARYAAIPRDAFAHSKRHLRAPALEAMDRYASKFDTRALATWSAPETRERIARYLDKTVGHRRAAGPST